MKKVVEMAKIIVDDEYCTGCGACVEICPSKILYIDEDGKCKVSDPDKCDKAKGAEAYNSTGKFDC